MVITLQKLYGPITSSQNLVWMLKPMIPHIHQKVGTGLLLNKAAFWEDERNLPSRSENVVGKLEFSWFEFPNHAKTGNIGAFLINWPRGGTERVRRTVALEDCQQTFKWSPCVSYSPGRGGEAEEHRSDGGEDRNES